MFASGLPRDVLTSLMTLSAALAGCEAHGVPGFGPPLVPSAPIQPEPTRCGKVGDPVRRSDVRDSIVGAADLHNHQFSNLGFGGNMLYGESFHHHGGIAQALSSCGAEGLCLDAKEAALCKMTCALWRRPDDCRASCKTAECSRATPHGHFGGLDPIGVALGQGMGHDVHGFPDFMGWPHWSTYTHQQVYHRWLRRAFDGGLKLIVMQAVTNEVLCKILHPAHPCDDMTNVDLQLQAAYDLEAYIDEQTDCDGTNKNGWYRIALTPQDARQIISEGGMAVVLGIEVDTLFNCYKKGTCSEASVVADIAMYYRRGVRHVFPMHVFDNGFGGAAAYGDFFNFGNAVINRDLLTVRDCASEGYTFRFGNESRSVRDFLSTLAAKFGVAYPDYSSAGAHCNSVGLTALGKTALRALMKQKMIIDVDHMSAKARAEALSIAEELHYPGMVSSHSGFTELYRGNKKSEGQLTSKETERLLAVGGMVAPILQQGERGDMIEFNGSSGHVAHDCGNSSKSFAQAYLYAIKASGKRGVGFGSDLNGLAGLPTPRFGPYACGGDVGAEQTHAVNYPIRIYRDLAPPMPRSQAGSRVFDINVDGFAHAGMFPDFVAELLAIGLRPDDLQPLFDSAEEYIRMWECAQGPAGCKRER
jgi:microsomal dipeptidase-like Zn-dependent dipeptidase